MIYPPISTPETRRALSAPRQRPVSFDAKRYDTAPCSVPGCRIVGVRPIQAAIVSAVLDAGGGLFPVGVGHGKTLIGPLLATETAAGTVVLVPPSVADAWRREVDHYLRHWPWLVVPGLVTYSALSSTGRGALDDLAPAIVVADEAHSLRDRDAARTQRVMRHLARSGAVFVALSGTLVARSVLDYAWMAEAALGEGSPVPRTYYDAQAWASVLDADGENRDRPGVLRVWGASPEDRRRGYREHVATARGVVATLEASAPNSLEIDAIDVRPPRPILDRVEETIATWSHAGIVYESPTDVGRVVRQLSAGGYYREEWPDDVPREEVVAYHRARLAWAQAARRAMRPAAGWDSPGQVAERCAEGVADQDVTDAWLRWTPIRDALARHRRLVWEWVDDYLVDAAARAVAASETPALVWVRDPPVGESLARRTGSRYLGEGCGEEVTRLDPARDPHPVLSIDAHAKGHNLQRYARNLVVCPPSSAVVWEQMIGRTHRPGQDADAVTVDVLIPRPLRSRWTAAREQAAWLEQVTGQPQKLCLATVGGDS